jgi:hypothetical protein
MRAKKGIFVALLISSLLMLASMASADDLVMFNYQGRVRVQGTAFSGTGYFKFAIVNNDGSVSLWSNDGTSVDGSEPVAAVAVEVTDGIFNVMIGDPDLGMEPMNRSIFNHPDRIKLRIWFSDGVHGFQRLLPDRRIVNPQLIGLVSGTEDFTIYVNGTTGNDNNNGLTTDTAKQTIQAAVDVLPERLRCNVTIDIADGIYREEVKVYGITVEPVKSLTFLGDETWTPSSSADPAVRITGSDDDVSSVPVRTNAVRAEDCTNITFRGLLVDYSAEDGMLLMHGMYKVENCKGSNNNQKGFRTLNNTYLDIADSVGSYNVWHGFEFAAESHVVGRNLLGEHNGNLGISLARYSTGEFFNCVLRYNTSHGARLYAAHAEFNESGDLSHNGNCGIRADDNSWICFTSPYDGHLDYNTGYGLFLSGDSTVLNPGYNTFAGNGGGSIYTQYGGHTYP